MKLIYYCSTGTTDCDFPLLKEFERKGLDFTAYCVVNERNKKGGLISIDELIKKDTILKAADVPAFALYKDYINLDNIYVINEYHNRTYQWQNWLLWWKVYRHMKKQRGTVFHSVWPLQRVKKIFYSLKAKKVLTVHDPFPHSSLKKDYDEVCRQESFDKFDKLILLNDVQKEEFLQYYNVNKKKVVVSKLGEYECLRFVKSSNIKLPERYILFFGQIQAHKGVDILLKAMQDVHAEHPNVKLIIAGKGKYNFDIEPYKKQDFIEFRNYYITVPELGALLKGCQFAICPYRDATQSGVVQTAFSVDVPLIVSDVGALPMVVKHDIMGLVTPPNDSRALAESINFLLSHPEKLESFRKNIQNIWRPTMSWSSIADDYINCYKELE